MKKLIAALALAPLVAHASFYDGSALLMDLNGNNGQQAAATTYLMGLVDAVGGVYVCPPSTMTGYQLALTARKILSVAPERLNLDAPMLVIPSLRNLWPCKKAAAL